MLRLNRVTDYAILIATHLLRQEESGHAISTAREIAAANHLSNPMVAKVLKQLVRRGIIVSERGQRGGYSLAPEVRRMTLGGFLRALEGPIRLTDCSPVSGTVAEVGCDLHASCSLRGTILTLNAIVENALEHVTLREIAIPQAPRSSAPAIPTVRVAAR